jgi:hypothetical protein
MFSVHQSSELTWKQITMKDDGDLDFAPLEETADTVDLEEALESNLDFDIGHWMKGQKLPELRFDTQRKALVADIPPSDQREFTILRQPEFTELKFYYFRNERQELSPGSLRFAKGGTVGIKTLTRRTWEAQMGTETAFIPLELIDDPYGGAYTGAVRCVALGKFVTKDDLVEGLVSGGEYLGIVDVLFDPAKLATTLLYMFQGSKLYMY